MKLFETKTDNSIPKDYKPIMIIDMLNAKVKTMNNYQLKNTLKTLGHIFVIWYTIQEHLEHGKHIIRINFMSSKDSGEKRPYACKDITGDFSE